MGIHCLLVSTNTVDSPYPVYPLGVAHLAGALGVAGHRVSRFDLLADGGAEALLAGLATLDPDLVALSVRNIDTVDSSAPNFFLTGLGELCGAIRTRSRAYLVLGGPAFSIMPEALLDLTKADYGVVGEGEALLPWLAWEIAAGRPPRERLFRAEGDAPWLPVSHDAASAAYYLTQGGMLSVQTKRGCPHRCTYCTYPQVEGRRLRYKPPELVADEVRWLTEELGARHLFFTDSVFNDHSGHYLEVAEALIRAGNTTPWTAYFRPQDLSRAALATLKRAGLAAMEIGTDAASDATLAGLGKGFTFGEVLATHTAVTATGIPSAHFVIFGGPGETPATFWEGLANLERLVGALVFGFVGVRVLPGTGMEAVAIQEGIVSPGEPLITPRFYHSPGLAGFPLDCELRRAWEGSHHRIYPCSVLAEKISILRRFGHSGPFWDLLLR